MTAPNVQSPFGFKPIQNTRHRGTLDSNDQRLRSSLEEALKRLIRILARQAARETVVSTPTPITEPADG
jgi:hypothetical protein